MSSMLNFLFGLLPFHAHIANIFQGWIISVLKTGPIPKHIAFVMDGNRRYAEGKSLALKEGHNAGAENLISILDTSYRLGIHTVTIYAFSIENFNRPQSEIDTLFQLLRDKLAFISNAGEYADRNKVKIKIIGNKSLIPKDILKDLDEVERLTKNNTNYLLNACFPYTSRDDIANCIKTVVNDVLEETIVDISNIDENTLNNNMYFGTEYPNVDLLIRTSGHTRLSDFMLWQTNKNSVIVFDNSLWPDFHLMNLIFHIFKWGYYKTLLLREAEVMELKNPKRKGLAIRELSHPPYSSVTGR